MNLLLLFIQEISPFASTYSQENDQGGIHKKICKTDKNENLTEQQIKEKCIFTAHLD